MSQKSPPRHDEPDRISALDFFPATGAYAHTRLAAENPRLAELQRAAILLRVTASNAIAEAYYRVYASGISRRIAGGAGRGDLEVVAFELRQDAPCGLHQVLGRGYRGGLEGKAISLGRGA